MFCLLTLLSFAAWILKVSYQWISNTMYLNLLLCSLPLLYSLFTVTQSERNMIYLNISDVPVIKGVILSDLYLLAWTCYENI